MGLFSSSSNYHQGVGVFIGQIGVPSMQFVLNEPTVTLNAHLIGDIRGHTFSWVQMTGSTVQFISPTNSVTTQFIQTPIADDKTFAFWIDYGTKYAIVRYITVTAKPTDFMQNIAPSSTTVLLGVDQNTSSQYGDSTMQVKSLSWGAALTVSPTNIFGLTSDSASTSSIVFGTPFNAFGLHSFSVYQNYGNGYILLAEIPYNAPDTYSFSPINSQFVTKVTANYNYNTASVSSTIYTGMGSVSIGDILLSPLIGGINTVQNIQTSFIDVRIIASSVSDTISSPFGVSTLPVSFGIDSLNTNNGYNSYTLTDKSFTYVFIDYHLSEINLVDTLPNLGIGSTAFIFNTIYTATGAGFTSLG